MDLFAITEELRRSVDSLAFSEPVAYVYNPLDYAAEPHGAYLERFGRGRREVLLVGMNPGPFGMVQTGVPFGDVGMVRDWMGIDGAVGRPPREHPKRPVQGFACPRGEGSGRRLWGWARERFGPAEDFFARFYVANYCPLAFFEESGANRTPDKLPKAEREALFAACDRALVDTVEVLEPELVVGIGRFAERRAAAALQDRGVPVGMVLHPSPASPKANQGWVEQAERDLGDLGVALP
ncbi:single-strand selective monofunctional uracil DNA glycosylase [Thiohalorhabdus denitrificans]|uniref:Single-strand selective monofunctional uracil DNA glycosylase n=1 Tax=Thiohalorhabdus denitrificans TaxID=381306 RepID=A0A1G5EWK1_9GAMM|nr:single-strand selective monofunctional uracil DNA glycosylase [Thiohalorhabdus denitrificans]